MDRRINPPIKSGDDDDGVGWKGESAPETIDCAIYSAAAMVVSGRKRVLAPPGNSTKPYLA
jgi:hypothetical protein